MRNELNEERAIALQLHGVLSAIDAGSWCGELAAGLRAQLTEIQQQLEVLHSRPRLKELSETLDTAVQHLEAPEAESRSRWLAFKRRLVPAYVRLSAYLRAERVHVPNLRPTNYPRSVFHALSAILGATALSVVQSRNLILGAAATAAALAWTMEASRRAFPAVNDRLMGLFGPFAHPHETQRINSATWYSTALLLLALTGATTLCGVAVLVLGLGDPMAALVGRRFGRLKLLHGRTLEGSLGFLLSAGAVAVLWTWGVRGLPLAPALLVALGAALAGTLMELTSFRIDDNLSIPLAAAAGGAGGLWLAGLPMQ
jgi:dolichol kinase